MENTLLEKLWKKKKVQLALCGFIAFLIVQVAAMPFYTTKVVVYGPVSPILFTISANGYVKVQKGNFNFDTFEFVGEAYETWHCPMSIIERFRLKRLLAEVVLSSPYDAENVSDYNDFSCAMALACGTRYYSMAVSDPGSSRWVFLKDGDINEALIKLVDLLVENSPTYVAW